MTLPRDVPIRREEKVSNLEIVYVAENKIELAYIDSSGNVQHIEFYTDSPKCHIRASMTYKGAKK